MPKGAKYKWNLEEVKEQFDQIAERKDIPDARFIKNHDLREIWDRPPQGETQSRLVLLVRRYIVKGHYFPPRFEHQLRDDYLRVISILVYITWTKWEEFREIFIEQYDQQQDQVIIKRKDMNLPFSLDNLRSQNFLDRFGSAFYDSQFIFSPIVVRYQSINKSRIGSRLPVISSAKIGEGGSGVVFAETIAPGYLEVSENQDLNTVAKTVARKSIVTKENFHGESRNVSHLQSCLSQHRGITRSLGMIIWEGFHETRFDIFYELASFDLRAFLNGPSLGYSEYLKIYPERYRNFTSGHLLEQMAHLADALSHLHSGYYHPSMGRVCLAHNDFKPDNILVFYTPEYPAGQWKIADFGLSNIKYDKSDRSGGYQSHLTLAPRDLIVQISPTTCKRNPAGYSAPEIERVGISQEDGRESDVWSFGCVFAMVLAYALGQTPTVRLLLACRDANSNNDRFYEKRPDMHGYFRIKLPIVDWLHDLPQAHPRDSGWVQECVDLIFEIFRVLVVGRSSGAGSNGRAGHITSLKGRPRAKYIRDEIHDIREKAEGRVPRQRKRSSMQDRLFHRPETPPTESADSSPIKDRIDSGCHGRGPFLVTPPRDTALASAGPVTDRYEDQYAIAPQVERLRQSSQDQTLVIRPQLPQGDEMSSREVHGLGMNVPHPQTDVPRIFTPNRETTNAEPEAVKSPNHLNRMYGGSPPKDQALGTPDSASRSPTSSSTPSIRSEADYRAPGSRHSSIIVERVSHPLEPLPGAVSARIKFPAAKMTHTRLAPDGSHVAFWAKEKKSKVLICHLSLPSHNWSAPNDTKLKPMDHYSGLVVTPPKDFKCVTVALAADRAAIHYSKKGEVEVHVYSLSPKKDHYRCDGEPRGGMKHKDLAGLVDISMALNGTMILRFLDHVRLGHVDEPLSAFIKLETAGTTTDACIATDGSWLAILSHDSSTTKEHWYVRNVRKPGDNSGEFVQQGWYDSAREANREANGDQSSFVVPLTNAIARFYTSGFATVYQKIAKDKRNRVKLHTRPVVSGLVTPDRGSLLFIGAGQPRRTKAVLGTVQLRPGTGNSMSLDEPTFLSEIVTSWDEPHDCARHCAVGEGFARNGKPEIFAYISSADGTVERVQLTNDHARANSTASSTPSDIFQEFYSPKPLAPQPSYTSNQGPQPQPQWRSTFNQGTPPQSLYVPNSASPPHMKYAPNQTLTPRSSYPSNHAGPSHSYYSPDDFQAHHSYPPPGHASPPQQFARPS